MKIEIGENLMVVLIVLVIAAAFVLGHIFGG